MLRTIGRLTSSYPIFQQYTTLHLSHMIQQILIQQPIISIVCVASAKDNISGQVSSQVLAIINQQHINYLIQQGEYPVYGVLGQDGISQWQVWQIHLQMPIILLSVSHSSPSLLILLIAVGLQSELVFMVLDILLFYITFESVQIPMYLIITIYGSRNRKIMASYQLFIYTQLGSQLQLQSQQYLYIKYGTTDYTLQTTYREGIHPMIWLSFFICFAIKLPMIGFHSWLLAAHVEAPTSASVQLAAILLKLGSYGLQRYNMLWNDTNDYFRPQVITMSIISVIYSSIAAISQTDQKVIVAYSSIGHMGVSTLGQYSQDEQGIIGGIYSQISHGIISSAQFQLVGILYDRHKTRYIIYYRGLVQIYPIYVTILLYFSLANSALPLTSGFIGEFLSIYGILHHDIITGILTSLSVILVPSFMFGSILHKISYGSISPYQSYIFSDITRKEFHILLPLIISSLALGIAPDIIQIDLTPSVLRLQL